MATNSILVAIADPQALIDITQALRAGWEATSVATEADALAQLEKNSFNALLVDFNLGSPDASELLNRALESCPQTVRFLLAYEADLALVAAKVLGSHQILPKPIELDSLKGRIENGVAPENPSSNESPSQLAAGAVSPAVPAIYSEVLKALESPGVTNDQLAEIIASDAALTSEVLRLSNSTYLGLPQHVTNPAEAVESLGLDTVKALVTALRFLAEHRQLKPGYLSLEQLWQHSTNVGQIARDLVLFETRDRGLASQALTAGLLHDLGKVVLATNFDDLYGRVHSLARKQPVPLWEIEKEMFGANHGEIGACLIGMWNLPSAMVEAAALHHEPPRGEHERLTPLAAVHIANVLEREIWTSDECRVAPIIDTAFLNDLGLLERLPVWRAAFANRTAANQDLELESAETKPSEPTVLLTARPPWTANRLRGPAAATRTGTSGRRQGGDGKPVLQPPRFWERPWVYAGVAAAAMLLLALRIGTQSVPDQPEPVSARTPAPFDIPPVVSSPFPPEAAPAPAPQVTPAITVSPEAPGASPDAVAQPAVPPPAPEPTPATAPAATVAAASPPSLVPKPIPQPDFRLTGIIYTVARPSAIVNGETLYVGDLIKGATVISISPTAVTLQINGQRKTYILR